ncbi:MAG: sulfotransferase [Deltaproteobacteria bacterium]|nr:sulfotransferase [Deltaproteobacteria bacterium]
MKKTSILLTGSHRSGTTFVAEILSFNRKISYVEEPSNKDLALGKLANFKGYFPYICSLNESRYEEHYRKLIETYSRVKGYRHKSPHKKWLNRWRDLLRPGTTSYIPMFKDPIGFFSAEWLAEKFEMSVIITVRHPAAFAHSLKRLGWTFQFEDLLRQQLLTSGPLAAFKSQIERFCLEEKTIIEQAAALWSMIYSVALGYKQRHPAWLFLRIEDIASDPLGEFTKVFKYLHLNLTDSIKSAIFDMTGSHNPSEAGPGVVHNLRRDSKKAVKAWQKELTNKEKQQIFSIVHSVSQYYYSEEAWK